MIQVVDIPMEYTNLISWQRASGTSVLTQGATAKRRNVVGNASNCSCNRAQSKVNVLRSAGNGRIGDKISHLYPFSPLSTVWRRSPALERGLEKCFSSLPDTQFEGVLGDANEGGEAQDVPAESLGVVDTKSEGENEEVQLVESVLSGGKVSKFPPRYILILATSLAFVICNMDKVNMSVAIIPMSHQLGWSASTAGLVQSSFFWGYALSQLPGGFLAGRFSGKKVLRTGVLLWSIATALVPLTSSFLPGLLFCRLLVGLGEGVSPAAATDLIARNMPVNERSRAVSFVFGGLNVGSVLGLLLAPAIIKLFGWEVVFYIFGGLGVLWCWGFDATGAKSDGKGQAAPSKRNSSTGVKAAPGNGQALKSGLENEASDPHAASFDISDKAIPWRAFFRDPAIWAMMYAHFCGNWGHYNLLAWFPTYFSEELNLNLTNSALVSLLPPLGSVVVAAVASSLADDLISKGTDCTFVRKLCQTIAFASPAVCMTVISLCPDLSPWLTASILTIGSSVSTFTLAGLYCSHQDISPKYASVLLGLTNTVGAVPGIVGVALTGYILDQTKSWTLALFAPSIFFYVTGAIVWNLFASSKPKEY